MHRTLSWSALLPAHLLLQLHDHVIGLDGCELDHTLVRWQLVQCEHRWGHECWLTTSLGLVGTWWCTTHALRKRQVCAEQQRIDSVSNSGWLWEASEPGRHSCCTKQKCLIVLPCTVQALYCAATCCDCDTVHLADWDTNGFRSLAQVRRWGLLQVSLAASCHVAASAHLALVACHMQAGRHERHANA